MKKEDSIVVFNQKKVRRHWDHEKELWFFSIVDIIEVLTETDRPRKYWNDLKIKLKIEGSQLSEKIGQLKLMASDGKKYFTDIADTETILRLIQSIPSPKAEPFKIWFAQVGYQRIEETENPELSIDRAMSNYLKKGYSREWINQSLMSIEVRKDLTDEWSDRGIKEKSDFAILTNVLTKTWSDKSVKEYKQHKGLKKESLKDNMTNLESVLNMLAEVSTTEISKEKLLGGIDQNIDIAIKGGTVSKNAKKEIEKQPGKSVISSKNIKELRNGNLKHLE